MATSDPFDLTTSERRQLEQLVATRSARAGHVRRARVILLSAEGVSGVEIAGRVGLTPPRVSMIRARFRNSGVEGLADQPKAGRKDHAITTEQAERIVAMAISPPPAGHSRWSTRMIGDAVGLSSPSICKVLQANDLKPHRERTFKISKDPHFTRKVRDVVGLYLNPPENAVVLSIDEKTQIQALERSQPMLPMRSGSVARRTHDYERHGVIDLFAALDVGSGRVHHRFSDRHTSRDFLAFLKQVARAHRGRALHVILDNSSTHGAPPVRDWLARHPHIHMHYTPTSASWLNQVEGVFSILTRRSLQRTSFTSRAELQRHIEAFLARLNERPRPFIWTKGPLAIIRDHRRLLARI